MKLTEERAALRQRVAALQEKSWIKASPKAAQAVAELARDLENDFFTVVVLGEFKRGKKERPCGSGWRLYRKKAG